MNSRIEARVDSGFKKTFLQFCKNTKEKPSLVVRKALQQYVTLGDFKSQLFDFLHTYPEAKFRFQKFLNSARTSFLYRCNVGKWFDELLGSEEKKLIENTPVALLNGLRDLIMTNAGRTFLEKRVSNNK